MAKQCTTGFVGNGTVEVYPWNGKLEPDKKLVTLEETKVRAPLVVKSVSKSVTLPSPEPGSFTCPFV